MKILYQFLILFFIRNQILCQFSQSKDKKLSEAYKYLSEYPYDSGVIFQAAILEEEANREEVANTLFRRCVDIDPYKISCWQRLVRNILASRQYSEGEKLIDYAVSKNPNSSDLIFLAGLSRHYQSRFNEALDFYSASLKIDPEQETVIINIGAIFQAFGQAEEAIEYYSLALKKAETRGLSKEDCGLLNNYGALLMIMNRENEGVAFLKKALEFDPYMENVLINIGSYYQDEGDLSRAETYFRQGITSFKGSALRLKNKDYDSSNLLVIRIAIMMHPIAYDWNTMINDRRRMENNLIYLLRLTDLNAIKEEEKSILDSCIDRTHFYISYHGLNDRFIQEMIMEVYRRYIRQLEWMPSVLPITYSPSHLQNLVKKSEKKLVKVGFISKFFGIFEPHGMLLDGIMKYLPKSIFYVIALPVARTDGKPLSPVIRESANEIHEIPLTHEYAREIIVSLELDLLVYADTVSEPMTHFLSHSRLAPIQMAFWGNPITSGSRQIDYFVSADCMEYPFRTRLRDIDEPYTEQLVILEGQGIWYFATEDTNLLLKKANIQKEISSVYNSDINTLRNEFGFKSDWFIFFCPQSVFKMHPLFDHVFNDILRITHDLNLNAHIVITGGRKERWTDIYVNRLNRAIDPDLMFKFHLIPRVSAENFLSLVKIADVLLHPFPFDGSRTSADGLSVGVPFLTLPSEYLRGRMGQAFYRTMNLPELTAKNRSDYVNIAKKLVADKEFYKKTRQVIYDRSYLIWEDMHVPYQWTQFFSKVASVPIPSWESFISDAGRNITMETELHRIRETNRKKFDESWGSETWLLDHGKGQLDSTFGQSADGYLPRIFNDWNSKGYKIMNQQDKILTREEMIRFTDLEDEDMKEFKKLTMNNFLDKAYDLGIKILENHTNYIQGYNFNEYFTINPHLFDDSLKISRHSFREIGLLNDLGVLQFYMGNHNDAFDLCTRSLQIFKSYHGLICIGVSGTYLNKENETIDSLSEAWKIRLEESNTTSNFFNVPLEALASNLITALNTFGRVEDCLVFGEEIVKLPSVQNGGLWILTLAFFDWQPVRLDLLKRLEIELINNKLLKLPPGTTLIKEIIRIQKEFEYLLNTLFECYHHDVQLKNLWEEEIIKTVYNVLQQSTQENSLGLKSNAMMGKDSPINPGLVLITQYFELKNNEYQSDIDECLTYNLNNPLITEIVLLNEKIYDFSKFPSHHKIKQVNIGRRLRFSDAFNYANNHFARRTVILANSDIYFDESLHYLSYSTIDFDNKIMALLKWKAGPIGINLQLRTDSQDAWIFQPPLKSSLIQQADFDIGTVRCDNILADLIYQSGYKPINPCLAIHAIEIQNYARPKRLYDTKNALFGGNNKYIFISDITEISL